MSNHSYTQWLSGESLYTFYGDVLFQLDAIIDFTTDALSSDDVSLADGALQNLIIFYYVATGETPTLDPGFLPEIRNAYNTVDIQLKLNELIATEILIDNARDLLPH